MENNNNNLEAHVRQSCDELVICDFKECPERGEYIRCYFDFYPHCDTYKKRKLYKEQ